MTTPRIWAISYLLLVIAVAGLAVYARSVDLTTEQCIARVIELRSVPANAKDRAELRLVKARRPIVLAAATGVPPTAAESAEYKAAERAYEETLAYTLNVRNQTRPDRYCD